MVFASQDSMLPSQSWSHPCPDEFEIFVHPRIEVPCRHRRKTMKPYSFTPHSPVALTGTAKNQRENIKLLKFSYVAGEHSQTQPYPVQLGQNIGKLFGGQQRCTQLAQCVNQGIVKFLFTYTLCSGSRDRSTFAQIFQRLVVSNLHDEITAKLWEVRLKLLTAPTRWLEFEK